MKKTLFLLLFALTFLCLSFGVLAEETVTDEIVVEETAELYSEEAELMDSSYGDWYYIIKNGGVTITDCSTFATSVVIPETIDGYPVTSIGDDAFADCIRLESITIPDSVTSIGDDAFIRCTSLESVEIGNSVTSIGSSAFEDCTSLESVEIGDGVTSIGDYAFSFCRSLTSVEIGNSVTSIGNYVFEDCYSLTIIKIPDSVTSIGDDAFSSCTSLESVEIGNSVTSIGDSAFRRCTSLESITIPDSVTSIGISAFYYCTSLESVEIGNGVTSIGEGAFPSCRRLESVYITDIEAWCNIEFEDDDANPFYCADNLYLNGTKLSVLHIPSAVSSINEYTFYNCNWIEKLYIPKSVNKILPYAFSGCGNVTEIYYEGTEDEWDRIAIGTNNNIFDNVPIYFEYVPEANKVFFDENTSDDVTDMPQTKYALGTFAMPSDSPKREGYVFLGWSTESDGEAQYSAGDKVEIFEETTFYAVWKKITIFDNPVTLESGCLVSADGKMATIIINLRDSMGFGGLCFDVEYNKNVLSFVNAMPVFASEYCSVDSSEEGVIHFTFESDENVIGNGSLAIVNLAFDEEAENIFTDIVIDPVENKCFGYDEDDDNSAAPLAVDTVDAKITPKGDLNGDGRVNENDAILLLQHALFPNLYPLN